MGRARTAQSPPSQQSSEEEVAAAIAAVLAGGLVLPAGTTPLAAISALLGTLGLPDASVRDAAARLVSEDPDLMPDNAAQLRAGPALRRAHLDNLIYRAYYAINAAKRITARVAEGEEASLRGALDKERPYLQQHREANRRREAAARMVDAAVELHGPVLGWRHGHPKEPRPSHKAADGKNWEAGTVPLSTGALPGVLPGCTCVPVAPFPNAETLR